MQSPQTIVDRSIKVGFATALPLVSLAWSASSNAGFGDRYDEPLRLGLLFLGAIGCLIVVGIRVKTLVDLNARRPAIQGMFSNRLMQYRFPNGDVLGILFAVLLGTPIVSSNSLGLTVLPVRIVVWVFSFCLIVIAGASYAIYRRCPAHEATIAKNPN